MRVEPQKNIFALRPLELKHFFEFTIRIFRFNFLPLFLSMAFVQLPVSLMTLPLIVAIVDLQTEIQEMTQTGDVPGTQFFYDHLDLGIWAAAMMFFSLAYQLLVMPLGNLSCCRLATMAIFGKRISLLEAFQFAKKRYWPTQVALATFMLPLLVVSLLLLLPVLAFSMAGEASGLLGSSLFALFLILAGGLATFLYWYRFFPALQGVIQCSEDPVGEGIFSQGLWYLQRAYGLSGGYYLRLFGLIILAGIIISYIRSGFNQSAQLIVELVSMLMEGGISQAKLMEAAFNTEPDKVVVGVSLVVSMLLGLVFPPLMNCYYVLLYYDLRFRKEGLDIKLALGSEQPPQ